MYLPRAMFGIDWVREIRRSERLFFAWTTSQIFSTRLAWFSLSLYKDVFLKVEFTLSFEKDGVGSKSMKFAPCNTWQGGGKLHVRHVASTSTYSISCKLISSLSHHLNVGSSFEVWIDILLERPSVHTFPITPSCFNLSLVWIPCFRVFHLITGIYWLL